MRNAILIIILILSSFLVAHEVLPLIGKNSVTGLEVNKDNPVDAIREGNVLITAVWLSVDDLAAINDSNDPNFHKVLARDSNILRKINDNTKAVREKLTENITIAEIKAME